MSTNICKQCGKPCKKPFILCYECNERKKRAEEYRRYVEMSEDDKEAEREEYYSTMCVMCGKEGASERKDGKCYCGSCWTIWNS
jgi:hypothetical protein